MLNHLHSSSPVCYSVLGWREISTNMARTNLAAELLRKSKKFGISFKKKHLIVFHFSLVLRSAASHVLGPQTFGGSHSLSMDELKAKMSCLQVGKRD